jgi:hypothetical protein
MIILDSRGAPPRDVSTFDIPEDVLEEEGQTKTDKAQGGKKGAKKPKESGKASNKKADKPDKNPEDIPF